ncbi:MAG TPA: transglycosylase domain-containing protein [Pseudonocardiaceae bacterium]
MSDQPGDSGRRPAHPGAPPERFAQPPRPPAQRRPPEGPGGNPDGPVTVRTNVLPARAPQPEPELLTHATRNSPAAGPASGVDHRGSYPDEYADPQGDEPPWDEPDRWRLARKIVLVAVLLAVLTPVVGFFVGWLFLTVPSPAELTAQRKQITTIMGSDGTTELGRYVPDEGNRITVPLRQVPVPVQNAVLAAEDRSFRSNLGFDVVGIGRAVWSQLTGGDGGGSTITQQYIKVVTGHDEHSIFRKFREMIIAAKITKQYSKDRILEDYLNTIYFGRGAYGIQAASQAYFGKNVQDLSASEGAVLAGAIQSPSRWDPAKNPQQAQERWSFVLDGMIAQGWLSREEAATRYPATIPPGQVAGSPTDDRAHIVDRVLEELEKQGINRDQLAINGGRITTTIDSHAQGLARDAVLTELHGQPKNLHSSLVAVDPRTGSVIAYYGGTDGEGFDLAGGPAWNPGSSFKPFTMLAALEKGIGMNAIYNGDSPVVIDGISYANSESRSYHSLTLHDAMTQSVNTTFVRLAQDVGSQAVRNAAIQAGIPAQINGKPAMVEPDSGVPAVGITLGQYPVHTIDMASAYATFAADGMRRDPFFVRQYANSHGNVEYTHVDKPQPAFDPTNPQRNSQLARNVTATMTDVARSSQIPLDGNRQVAAKTGTHQRGNTGTNSAAWTVGYTPSISAAVWVGDPANSAIKNANGADIFGRGVPGAIWQRFMKSYLNRTPLETFPAPTLIGPPPPAPVEQAPPPTSQKRDNPKARQSQAPDPAFGFDPLPVPTDPPTETPKPSLGRCTFHPDAAGCPGAANGG